MNLIRIWGVALFALQPETVKKFIDGNYDASLLGSLFSENGVVGWDEQLSNIKQYQIILSGLGRSFTSNNSLYTPSNVELLQYLGIQFESLCGPLHSYNQNRINEFISVIKEISLS